MSLVSLTPILSAWIARHRLVEPSSWPWPGGEALVTHVSSIAGECFQLGLWAPAEGQVEVRMACIEGRRDEDEPVAWPVSMETLEAKLEQAFDLATAWMAPSTRYFHSSAPN